ncbi:hypothetical protein JVU11DRAFT_1269 [Chiua virens]|nr:hypothetical protein JVU11DRAFT_1269 [Chiua virens]
MINRQRERKTRLGYYLCMLYKTSEIQQYQTTVPSIIWHPSVAFAHSRAQRTQYPLAYPTRPSAPTPSPNRASIPNRASPPHPPAATSNPPRSPDLPPRAEPAPNAARPTVKSHSPTSTSSTRTPTPVLRSNNPSTPSSPRFDAAKGSERRVVELVATSPDPIVRLTTRNDIEARYKEMRRAVRKGEKVGEESKSVQLTWGVGKADLEHKLRKARRDLDKGYRVAVAVSVKYSRRPSSRQELVAFGDEIANALGEVGRECKEREVSDRLMVLSFRKTSSS